MTVKSRQKIIRLKRVTKQHRWFYPYNFKIAFPNIHYNFWFRKTIVIGKQYRRNEVPKNREKLYFKRKPINFIFSDDLDLIFAYDEPESAYYNCPNCGKEYDEIDEEYQICHLCKHDANELWDVDKELFKGDQSENSSTW